jgi:hypothetical protein
MLELEYKVDSLSLKPIDRMTASDLVTQLSHETFSSMGQDIAAYIPGIFLTVASDIDDAVLAGGEFFLNNKPVSLSQAKDILGELMREFSLGCKELAQENLEGKWRARSRSINSFLDSLRACGLTDEQLVAISPIDKFIFTQLYLVILERCQQIIAPYTRRCGVLNGEQAADFQDHDQQGPLISAQECLQSLTKKVFAAIVPEIAQYLLTFKGQRFEVDQAGKYNITHEFKNYLAALHRPNKSGNDEFFIKSLKCQIAHAAEKAKDCMESAPRELAQVRHLGEEVTRKINVFNQKVGPYPGVAAELFPVLEQTKHASLCELIKNEEKNMQDILFASKKLQKIVVESKNIQDISELFKNIDVISKSHHQVEHVKAILNHANKLGSSISETLAYGEAVLDALHQKPVNGFIEKVAAEKKLSALVQLLAKNKRQQSLSQGIISIIEGKIEYLRGLISAMDQPTVEERKSTILESAEIIWKIAAISSPIFLGLELMSGGLLFGGATLFAGITLGVFVPAVVLALAVLIGVVYEVVTRYQEFKKQQSNPELVQTADRVSQKFDHPCSADVRASPRASNDSCGELYEEKKSDPTSQGYVASTASTGSMLNDMDVVSDKAEEKVNKFQGSSSGLPPSQQPSTSCIQAEKQQLASRNTKTYVL